MVIILSVGVAAALFVGLFIPSRTAPGYIYRVETKNAFADCGWVEYANPWWVPVPKDAEFRGNTTVYWDLYGMYEGSIEAMNCM